jgi:hypothetical protein
VLPLSGVSGSQSRKDFVQRCAVHLDSREDNAKLARRSALKIVVKHRSKLVPTKQSGEQKPTEVPAHCRIHGRIVPAVGAYGGSAISLRAHQTSMREQLPELAHSRARVHP